MPFLFNQWGIPTCWRAAPCAWNQIMQCKTVHSSLVLFSRLRTMQPRQAYSSSRHPMVGGTSSRDPDNSQYDQICAKCIKAGMRKNHKAVNCEAPTVGCDTTTRCVAAQGTLFSHQWVYLLCDQMSAPIALHGQLHVHVAERLGYDGSFRYFARGIDLWHFRTSIPANKAHIWVISYWVRMCHFPVT